MEDVEDDALLLAELVELLADVVDDGVGGGDEVEVELVGAAGVALTFDDVEGPAEEEVFGCSPYGEGVGVVVARAVQPVTMAQSKPMSLRAQALMRLRRIAEVRGAAGATSGRGGR